MEPTTEQLEIADQVSEVLNQEQVTADDIRKVRDLLAELPDEIVALYEEALFLVENDETR